MMWLATVLLTMVIPPQVSGDAASSCFEIEVVDQQTGPGVPLVELETVNGVRFVTDSAGRVAFYEPGLMGQRVFFHIRSHGYEFPKDHFGYRGTTLLVAAGKRAQLKIHRLNIAERLYRITGAGIYRDSCLLGKPVPLAHPTLNAQVFGSDSVVNALFRNKIYWFWGDTNRPRYPLGTFHVPGATSALPKDGGLDPSKGIDLSYFTAADGFVAPTAKMPGKGPTWINGLVVLHDDDGRERMFAKYVKVRPPLTVYERGLAEFTPDTNQFERIRTLAMDLPLVPFGHPFLHRAEGTEYVYFADPYPWVRVPATVAAFQDPAQYQAYSCFSPGSRAKNVLLDRNPDGKLQYGWKSDCIPMNISLQKQLQRNGKLTQDEGLIRITDAETGRPVIAHRGSVYWNAFRQRWIMIFTQTGGTSRLGEIWYAESQQPEGPWLKARKIMTHDRYSFYNPKQHPLFDQEGGRVIYFEGTYTRMFSSSPSATARYNYNQIMYRLDLDDPRLKGL